MDDGSIRFATIPRLGRLLRRRELSAVELARLTVSSLAEEGRAYNAVAELTAETAQEDARHADRLLRRGEGGPLTGIPYGAKDIIDTAGHPTRWGAVAYQHRIATADATVVRRLRRAGAVLVAKLALIELAGAGGYDDPAASINGPCRNPWDVRRWTGGSSSGSAAVVAAGLVPFSLGSDTGGSLMVPASYCGISTVRPSFGAVSRAGAMQISWSMDKIGPMARTASDCGSVLRVIAGRDEADWTTEEWTYHSSVRRDFRLGVLRTDFAGAPTTQAVFDEALRVLRALRFRIHPVSLPELPYRKLQESVVGPEVGIAHRELIESSLIEQVIDPAQREGLRRRAAVSAKDYALAIQERARLKGVVRALFLDADALVAPTFLVEAPLLTENYVAHRERRGGAVWLGSLLGLPAVSVPMGSGPNQMPLGLSFIGDLFAEPSLVRIASLFQSATKWHCLQPTTVSTRLRRQC